MINEYDLEYKLNQLAKTHDKNLYKEIQEHIKKLKNESKEMNAVITEMKDFNE